MHSNIKKPELGSPAMTVHNSGLSLVDRIRNRHNDFSMPTEQLLDEAADELERLLKKLN